MNLWSVINQTVDLCYQGLKRPWILLLTAAVVGVLLAGVWWLPQLPGQLSGDPAAAARWLLDVSSRHGALGGLLQMLGMFNALHSPLLQLSLAILALILCTYLYDCLALAWRFYRLPALLETQPQAVGVPLATMLPVRIYRQRQAAPLLPEALYQQVQDYLQSNFFQIKESRVDLPAELPGDEADQIAEELVHAQEWRLLATRYIYGVYLRPLGILGTLLALGAVWWIVLAGWSITPPLLAPGDLYRYAQRKLELNYEAPTTETTPHLRARIAARQEQRPIAQATRIWLGAVEVDVQPGPPALLLRASQGEATLGRAGQSREASLLGLVFPSVGNEESIVLRQQRVGLRIVRTAEASTAGNLSGFLVELDRVKEAKREQVKLGNTQRQTIPIDKEVTLEVTLLPSLAVTVNYLPGRWLLWLALPLCLVGGLGFVRRPVFILLQIGPWPDLRSVVVLQSNDAQGIVQLQGFLPHPE